MNENKNSVQYFEDEISLRELIISLWKRKIMIVCLTLIAAILAGIFSMFVLSPVYNTKLNIVISMPEKYNTRYGEYTLPISSNEQYINLILSNDVLVKTIDQMGYDREDVTIDGLKKRISIGKNETQSNTVQNSFELTVSADNPEESLKLTQTLYGSYIDFMDFMTKERAVNYYYNNFSVELNVLIDYLDTEKEKLKYNEELFLQTPKTIANDDAVSVETVNPNYIKLENDIVANKQSIINIENSIREVNQYLEELNSETQAIKNYITGKTEKFESSIIEAVETNVYLPSPPVAPTQKTSPSNALNTVIGAVLGGMLSVIIALFQEYWFKETKELI